MTKTVEHSRIGEALHCARLQKRAALITFLVAGDPTQQISVDCIRAAAECSDIVEIGIPYSDPLADGPTIQRAAQRARNDGTTFEAALNVASHVSSRMTIPLIGFTYYNPVFVRGIEATANDFADAGMSGIIVPDLPVEEAGPLLAAFHAKRLSVTFLIAPTTPPKRAREIAEQCTDFVYVVSRLGVTGANGSDGETARRYVETIRRVTNKPLAVGFGVATPNDVRNIAAFADGVVVGSALVDRLAVAVAGAEVQCVRSFCQELRAACERQSII